ncbi:hypothetical protein SNE40_012101 [Patella caerulea]|uniref:G-protein coupled receptors family 1 profile domain-containing protein n=1 Tax=Patella caerulea TaxID=87958 RepID=A0AAN8PQ72_PATCE
MYNNSTNFNISRGNGSDWDNMAFFNKLFILSSAVHISIAIGTVISNILVLGTIFTTPTLRRELFYLMVSSLAIGDLFLGLAGMPFYTERITAKKIIMGCEIHLILQVFVIRGHVMITNLGLIIMNINYVIKQCSYKMPHIINQTTRLAVYIVVSLVPWVAMSIVVPPLIKSGLYKNIASYWSDTTCPLRIYKWAKVTLNILCYFVPLLGLIITMCIIIYGFVAQSRGSVAFRPRLLNNDKSMFHPKFIITANVLCLLLLLLEHVLHTVTIHGESRALVVLFHIAFMLAASKGVALPIVWLLVPEVNEAFRERCHISYWRPSPDAPQHVVNKTYKQFVRDEENTD